MTQRSPSLALHYAGHILSEKAGARFHASNEAKVRNAIGEWLDEHQPTLACGSLAAGADILIAEQCLARGIPLAVTLPFDPATFITTSVSTAGTQWVARFEHCLAHSSSCLQAFDALPDNENLGYALCTWLALGHAHFYALQHKCRALQLTVWDEQGGDQDAGTYADQLKAKQFNFTSYYIHSHTARVQQQTAQRSSDTPLFAALAPLTICPTTTVGKEPEIALDYGFNGAPSVCDFATSLGDDLLQPRLFLLLGLLNSDWFTKALNAPENFLPQGVFTR